MQLNRVTSARALTTTLRVVTPEQVRAIVTAPKLITLTPEPSITETIKTQTTVDKIALLTPVFWILAGATFIFLVWGDYK